jgi:PEGA domain
MVRDQGRGYRLIGIIGLVIGLASLSGCVERRYTIRTNPPGALVVVNGEEIGPSPVSRSFTYYGKREITLMLDGHQTQTIIQPVDAKWYDNYLTEFFTENILPFTLRDEREFDFQMTPSVIPAKNDLLARAESLRAIGSSPPPARPWGIREFVRNLFGYDVD